MSVLAAAWAAAGSPAAAGTMDGACARCGAAARLVPVRTAVSKQFTAFDRWADPCGAGLCAGCAWGYTTAALRAGAHLVTRLPPTLTAVGRAGAAGRLLAGPLRPDAALIVPLRPGRKHLLPDAPWGRVAVDDAAVPWSAGDARRLRAVRELRGLGFGSRMLAAAAPAFQVLARLPAARYGEVLGLWAELDPWRVPGSPWLGLAIHITTPMKEEQ